MILEEMSFSSIDLNPYDWKNALLEGEVDTVIFPLWQLPVELDDRLIIGALSKRLNTKICLVNLGSQNGNQKLSSIPAGFNVFSPYEIYIKQLKGIRSDFETSTLEIADYGLLPHFEIGLNQLFNEDQIIFTFQSRELIPLPGSGVWAYVVQKDQLTTRKWLASIHHSTTSRITNIERGVLKKLKSSPIAIHGVEDENGYLHFSAFNSTNQRAIRYSSGTSHGLVKQLVDMLNQ
jgi:porphobilinogen deaminase